MQLTLKSVSYVYNPDAVEPRYAVKDVSFTLNKGEFVGLIGHTGSGKSTLVQFLDGLLKPTSGQVLCDGEDIFEKGYPLRELRKKVGLVFQYPEHQLFESDILKDVCFGPKNMGCSQEEQLERAKKAIALVGLDESYYTKSPFDLSGGEKRRVAIAGILAMGPDILVLDEPTAGLDPAGRDEILDQVERLNKEEGIGVVLVSHSMEDVAERTDRILVMSRGVLQYDDTPRNVFRHREELAALGLDIPQVTDICHTLRDKGFDIPEDILTVAEAKEEILKVLKKS